MNLKRIAINIEPYVMVALLILALLAGFNVLARPGVVWQ
jgi:hypothetical protein